MAKGNISVDSENLFPIIKKWLYSDKDIFLRELVSNGCDAVTKLKQVSVKLKLTKTKNSKLPYQYLRTLKSLSSVITVSV